MALIVNGVEIETLQVKNKLTNEITEMEKLQTNTGVIIWESLKDIVEAPPYLHISGIDANGYVEGCEMYNNNPVEYAVGKWNFGTPSYYSLVSPTPTEQESYIGKYYIVENSSYVGEREMYSISADNIETLISDGTIIVGETSVYESVEDPTMATVITQKISAVDGNGYNARYFGLDSDFFPAPEKDVVPTQYIDTHLVIPNRYNSKKVTRILANAFSGYDAGDANTKRYYGQCYYIKTIEIARGIKAIDDYAFFAPSLTDVVIPEGVETVRVQVFRSIGKLDLPSTIKNIGLAFMFNGGNAGRYGTCIWRAVETEKVFSSYQIKSSGSIIYGVFAKWETVVFEKTVRVMPSASFNTTYDAPLPTLVFKHDPDQEITLSIPSFKSATTATIYTDCNAVLNYDWAGKNVTPTFYPLSDYVES